MDKALALADWKGFAERRAASRSERQAARHRHVLLPRSRGRHPEREGRPALRAPTARVDPAHRRAGDGAGASVDLPAHPGARLGIDRRAVKLIEGDSDEVPDGTPSVASRSLMMAGSAMRCAPATTRSRRGARSPRQLFEVAATDVEFARGAFPVAGTDRRPILDWPARKRRPAGGPEGRPRHHGDFISPQMASRTAATSARWRSIRRPAWSRSSAMSAVDDVGNIVHRDHRRRADPRRHRAGARPGARRARASTARTASSSTRRSWTTRCRAPTTSRALRADAPRRAVHHQSARRERRGRVRRRRLAAVGDERGARRAWPRAACVTSTCP